MYMRARLLILITLACLTTSVFAVSDSKVRFQKEKTAAIAAIESNQSKMTELSDEIWRYAETALREHRSAETLAVWAQNEGFRVTREVAGMPTAFVAEYGSGHPVIGIMGEYDALPGVSQTPTANKEALVEGAAGHGCGHNLFGVASLGAAIAIKDLMETGHLKGTIKFFGTPAEEAVGGKIYMVRDGVMDGVDVMLAWHPSDEFQSDTKGTQALIDLAIEFRGKTAHAAYDPWNGRSAADGVEIFTHAINMMREHIRPTSRMHYVIVNAGDVPNVVPENGKVWIWLRDVERSVVEEMLERVRKIAKGAALAADVESTLSVLGGDWEMLVNMTGQQVAWSNLNWLGSIGFTEEEQAFAREIQKNTGVDAKGLNDSLKDFDDDPGLPEGGSTDVADVSWVIPTIHISVTTSPRGAPWHAWPVVASGGMSIGHKGMMHAAKGLAATMIDLFMDPAVVRSIREDFKRSTEGVEYKPYVPDGPPVLPPGRE